MLGVFAEFETNLRRERQLEGMANAKARGVYRGRKATIDAARIKQMKTDGIGPSAIAKALKIGRASVYRTLTERSAGATSTLSMIGPFGRWRQRVRLVPWPSQWNYLAAPVVVPVSVPVVVPVRRS
jgi:DNA invertase Pin-like site-specific DNA recombinase